MGSGRTILEALALLDRRERLVYVVACLAQSLLALLDLLAIFLIGVLTAQAFSSNQGTESGFRVPGLATIDWFSGGAALWLAVIAGALLVTKSLSSLFLSRRIYTFIANRQATVARDLARRLLRQPLLQIQKRASQETVFALSGGVLAATVGILGSTSVLVAEASLTILLLGGLFAVDAALAILTIVLFGSMALILHHFLGRWSFALGARGAAADIAGTSTLQHVLRAYREVTVSGRRSEFAERFGQHRFEAARVQADYFVLSQISKYTFEIGLVLGGAGVVAVTSLASSTTEGLAKLAVFLLVAMRTFPSLLRIQGTLSAIRNSSGLAAPTFELLRELQSDDLETPLTVGYVGAPTLHTPASPFVPSIKLDGVSLRYPGARQDALSNVTFEVPVGTSLALVGPSGAGKTSVVDVLLGVIKPTAGTVLISGSDPESAISMWPGSISYVPQDVAILTGTVRENVALGWPSGEVSDDQVWACLTQVGLATYFAQQRTGLDTAVGEHGMQLSGGQRQRLGLARALYSRPRLLVLDEATSALDAETELQITNTLNSLAGNATLVIVAHRLSTVRNSDAIAYIRGGKLVDRGTFYELRQRVPEFDSQAQLMGL